MKRTVLFLAFFLCGVVCVAPLAGQSPAILGTWKANLKDATAFLDWLTAVDKGQKLIAGFGRATYGQALFIPESKAWQATHPAK